jgi:hypothetical protein
MPQRVIGGWWEDAVTIMDECAPPPPPLRPERTHKSGATRRTSYAQAQTLGPIIIVSRLHDRNTVETNGSFPQPPNSIDLSDVFDIVP